MQQASSVHMALGSTAVLTFPTDSGISCNKPAGVICKNGTFIRERVWQPTLPLSNAT